MPGRRINQPMKTKILYIMKEWFNQSETIYD